MQRMRVCGVLFVVACAGGAKPAPVVSGMPAGVPAAPAPVEEAAFDTATPPTLKLPTNFRPEGYVARLVIDPAQPTFTGTIAIRGDLDKKSAVLWLHGKQLHVRAASATRDKLSVPLAVTPRGEDLLELRPTTPLAAGHYELVLDYDGKVQPAGASAGAYVQKIGEGLYVTTQFEATSARLVFPCVDEPGSKVPWQLTLDVPKDQIAVSNTPVAREVPLDAGHVRLAFAPTRPLPSYLVAFAVGPFEIVDAGHAASGTPLRVLVPRGQAKRAAYAAAVLPKIVDALAAWTDIPYPYPKLDLLARDAGDGGAMENAGLIIANSEYVLADGGTSPPALTRYNIIDVIGHEAAHQWFGDLVTAAWWDDIWLNESFATFMEPKVLAALEPSWHAADHWLGNRIVGGLGDALTTSRKIRQPIESDADIHNAFDGATYSKGGFVLQMFEAGMGEDAFRTGLRAYLKAHADHNATLHDVVAALDTASGKHLGPAVGSFVDQAGMPELTLAVTCGADPAAPAHATITQRRYLAPGTVTPGKEQLWQFPLCVAFETAAHARGQVCGWMDQAVIDLELTGARCPAWVLPDVGAHVYARPAYTEAQVVALRDHGWRELTSVERRSVFDATRVAATTGRLPVALLMSLAPKLLAGDRYEVADVTGDIFASGWASGLPFQLKAALPAALVPAAKVRGRALLAPVARRVGLTAKPGDTLDQELERLDVIASEKWLADPALTREALALAAHYRDIPQQMRAEVLTIAITASPAVAPRLRADAIAESDPQQRAMLFGVLGAIQDPTRLRAMLDTALDPALGARDVTALLASAIDEPTRAAKEAWVRAHMAEVQRALPATGTETWAPTEFLVYLLTGSCDAALRDDEIAYVTKVFGAEPNLARPIKQATEALDQCIASRKLVEPSLRAWLTGH